MSYSGLGGGGNKGTVSYLLEDSWPRLYIVLGWTAKDGELQILLSIANTHLQYDELLNTELNSLAMKVKIIFCKRRHSEPVCWSLEPSQQLMKCGSVIVPIDWTPPVCHLH